MIVEKNANPKIVKVMQNIIYDAFPSDMSMEYEKKILSNTYSKITVA